MMLTLAEKLLADLLTPSFACGPVSAWVGNVGTLQGNLQQNIYY